MSFQRTRLRPPSSFSACRPSSSSFHSLTCPPTWNARSILFRVAFKTSLSAGAFNCFHTAMPISCARLFQPLALISPTVSLAFECAHSRRSAHCSSALGKSW